MKYPQPRVKRSGALGYKKIKFKNNHHNQNNQRNLVKF